MSIPNKLTGYTLVIDIDGTLVPAGKKDVSAAMTAVVAWLKEHNRVYLLSNKRMPERNEAVAARLGVLLISSPYKKPDPRTLRDVVREGPLMIMGDKALTDGLLAWRTGAEFVKVERLVAADEPLPDRIFSAVDDAAYYAWAAFMLMRPAQWLKNLLVFAPIFFAGEVLHPEALAASVAAFFALCFLASAGYVANDLSDVESDKKHPLKRYRPVAAGIIPPWAALFSIALMGAAGAVLLAVWAPAAMPVALLYLGSSLAYSMYFKHVAIVEMLFFGWFYLARVLVGGAASHVPLTAWLVLAVIFLALFLVTSKRYAQLGLGRTRRALKQYPKAFLEGLLFMGAGLVLVFYAVYAVLGGPEHAVYSVIPVAGGVLRYLQLSVGQEGIEFPERTLLSDPGLLLAAAAWVVTLLWAFYGAFGFAL